MKATLLYTLLEPQYVHYLRTRGRNSPSSTSPTRPGWTCRTDRRGTETCLRSWENWIIRVLSVPEKNNLQEESHVGRWHNHHCPRECSSAPSSSRWVRLSLDQNLLLVLIQAVKGREDKRKTTTWALGPIPHLGSICVLIWVLMADGWTEGGWCMDNTAYSCKYMIPDEHQNRFLEWIWQKY